jgi:hypothetical protein
MALWGKTDNAANSVSYAVNQFKKTANSTNKTAFYGNTSAWFAGNKQVAGIFAADSTEVGVKSGPIAIARLSSAGSGYGANAAVTITVTNGGTGAVINAHATATGRIDLLNIENGGSAFKANPTIAIAAPTAIVFNGNTGVTGGAITIASANSKFLVGDKVTYAGNTTSTPVGLTDQTAYYVSFSNTSVIKLAATNGGANIAITAASGDGTTAGGATIQGETATGYVAVGGGQNKGVTAGWNVRTAGTGGRAGRVQNECLVAMRNIAGDSAAPAEDTILPDA